MGVLRYAVNELFFRSGRSLVTVVSVALAVLAAIVLTSLASSYARALRVPIETVGADVIVQQQGDIPPKLEGLVFPHPSALIPADVVRQIKAIPGVISLTRGVYMWDLEPDRYESVLGIDDSKVGLAGLGERLIDGEPITAASHSILVDSDYATKNHVKVGDSVKVGVDTFPIAGIVDAARSGKLVRADVYMPLPLAQNLATAAPQVRALYAFGADDANLVLVKVNREELQGVVETVTNLIGKKGVVSSELSMRNALSGVLFLSQSMGLIIAAHHRPVRRCLRLARDRDLGGRAPARNGDPAGHRLVVAAHWRAGRDREPGAGGNRHGGWTCRCVCGGVLARTYFGDGRSALGPEFDAAFHSDRSAQPHPDITAPISISWLTGWRRHCRQLGDQPTGGSRRSYPAAAAALVAAARRMKEPRMSDTAMLAKSMPAPGAASRQEIIRVERVKKRYGDVEVLKGVRPHLVRCRTIHRHHGQVRLRQEHAAWHRRRAGKAG